MRTILVIAIGVVAAAGLAAGCGGGVRAGGLVEVVASTNVYGDIARQLGGRHVHVVSLVNDPRADPHLFEPSTRDALEVGRADVLIRNGAGYDDFMKTLADATEGGGRVEVDAAAAAGVRGHDANPHVWYDLPRLPRIARAVASAFARVDAAHARDYRARLARFTRSLSAFARVRIPPGLPVASTEPVAEYLVESLRLRNLAPGAFTRAMQNGTEPPPQAVARLQALLRGHRVDALLYNSQAVSPITRRVRSEAERSRVGVVGVTETLPDGLTFQQWQLRQLRALRRALER